MDIGIKGGIGEKHGYKGEEGRYDSRERRERMALRGIEEESEV